MKFNYQFPIIIWDAQRVREFFDNSRFVYELKYEQLTDEFSEVHFSFDENGESSAVMKFLCGCPLSLRIRIDTSSDIQEAIALWSVDHFMYDLLGSYYPRILPRERGAEMTVGITKVYAFDCPKWTKQ